MSARKEETCHFSFIKSHSVTNIECSYPVRAPACFRLLNKQTSGSSERVRTWQNRCSPLWPLLFSPGSLRGANRAALWPLDIQIPRRLVQWNSFPCLLIHTFSLFGFFFSAPLWSTFLSSPWTLVKNHPAQTKWAKWITGDKKMKNCRWRRSFRYSFYKLGPLLPVVVIGNGEFQHHFQQLHKLPVIGGDILSSVIVRNNVNGWMSETGCYRTKTGRYRFNRIEELYSSHEGNSHVEKL